MQEYLTARVEDWIPSNGRQTIGKQFINTTCTQVRVRLLRFNFWRAERRGCSLNGLINWICMLYSVDAGHVITQIVKLNFPTTTKNIR